MFCDFFLLILFLVSEVIFTLKGSVQQDKRSLN